MRTQVAIVGGGPAGMLLSEMLHRCGVETVVLEKHSRQHVLSRIRAGVLEPTTVDVLRANGLAERMDREGQAHDGMKIVWAGRDGFFIDVKRHVGKRFIAYGQTSLQEDLFVAAERRGANVIFEAGDAQPTEIASERPLVTFKLRGEHILGGLAAELGEKLLVLRLDRQQVPGRRHHVPGVGQPGPPGDEQVRVVPGAGFFEHLDRLVLAPGVRADPQAGAQ